jgi:hypothetical protein
MEAFTDKDRETEGAPEGVETVGVVVLGPGRSGTSAIMRAFVAAGFFAGEDGELHGPDKGNPLGHFESLAVLRANEELLERLGCSWWADTPVPGTQLPHRAEAVPRLRAIVESLISAAGEAPVAIKEPRINSLLPLWWPAIAGRLHPVLAVRDPLEVAFSHSARDGTSIVHALAAWEAQTAAVLQHLAGKETTIAPYAELTRRSEAAGEIVAAAAAHLDDRFRTRVQPQDAGSALRSDLRHQDAGGLDRSDYLTRRQIQLWEYTRSLPIGQARIEPPAELQASSAAALDAMRRESEKIRLAQAHGRLVEELEGVSGRERQLERSLAEAGKQLADAIALAQREAASADHGARELVAVHDSISWKLTSPLRAVKRLFGR